MFIIVSISKIKCQTLAEIHTCRGLAMAAWCLLRVNSTWPCNVRKWVLKNRNQDYESQQQQHRSYATLDFVYLILLVGEYDSRKGMGFDRSVLTFGIGFDPLSILVTSPACRFSTISYLPRIDIIIQGPILPQRPRHLQARRCGRNPKWSQATAEQVAAIWVLLASAVASICNTWRSLQNPHQQRKSGFRKNQSVYASRNKNNCFINGTCNCVQEQGYNQFGWETSNFLQRRNWIPNGSK